MQLLVAPSKNTWPTLCVRPVKDLAEIEARVLPILHKVKHEGDKAIREYSVVLDKKQLDEIAVSSDQLSQAENEISAELASAIRQAYSNVYKFHQGQFKAEEPALETMPGVTCWRKSVGIDSVGLYIPGGTAPLFSTVLMLGIPAQIASCKNVVLCSPSNHPAIRFAAHLCGITQMYQIGGAQSVAAMAYGTESVPKVYKIFGPGNQYVTAAKMLVNKEGTAIDMPAGPSEVAVFADKTANPAFVAADLLSQAEHGTDSQVVLVCTDKELVNKVLIEINLQTKALPRADMVQETLKNSKAIVFKTEAESIDFLNEYAAEHLILASDRAEAILPKIQNAGSIFLGHLTPESAGDYASGTNHTLPTNGYAKAYSGVSVDSFVKKITVQRITDVGLKNVGPVVEIMAENEQLLAHKNAVSIRLATLN
jgi:histidinol dehydrogenase